MIAALLVCAAVTFALRFRAADRTLTAAEATEAKMSGVAVAAERFGAAIRDGEASV